MKDYALTLPRLLYTIYQYRLHGVFGDMKKIITDSTALILLAKCSLLETFCTHFEIIVPQSVINETASPELVQIYPDASLIHDLLNRNIIKILKPESHELNVPITLHAGERDALIIALKSKGILFASDDGKAIKAARFLQIPFIITPKIIIDLYILGAITFNKARKSIEKLDSIGRYSPVIIAESILSLVEAKNGKTDNNKNT